MDTVSIAELKNRLSAYLHRVRAGQEIVIRDRNLPIAKLVPLSTTEATAEELALVAAGKLKLPAAELDEKAFWAAGSRKRASKALLKAAARAISEDREERDAGVLGR